MAGKLSPTAQQTLNKYESFVPTVARMHTLVEQFAVAKTGHDNYKSMLKRAASQAKLAFMMAGLDQLSQLAGSIELAAARGGNPGTQARTFRELIGSLKFQLDLAIRTVVREDHEMQMKKKHGDAQ
ncbi:MAG: hypothetical protein ACT443_04355 [Gemmatimonadota bacterium]